VADAGVGPKDRVLEIGAGLGSLTVALAATGADVLAVEFDRLILPALEEVVGDDPGVRILAADAMRLDLEELARDGRRALVANLPFNISVPLVLDLLERAMFLERFTVVVQREVGERLTAQAGTEAYGAVKIGRASCRERV